MTGRMGFTRAWNDFTFGAAGCAAALVFWFAPQPALAGDVEAALTRVETAAQADPNLSPELKAGLTDLVRALRAEREEGFGEVLHIEGKDTFAEHRQRMNIFGDMRLRHESNVNLDDVPDRHRERARARLSMTYDVSDTVLIGVRGITGNFRDPGSSHETFGNSSSGSGLGSWDFTLDRVYVTWSPALVDGLEITGGKFAHPFKRNPVFGELVWDDDVQPEGYKLTYTREDLGALDELFLTQGGYVLQEQGGGDEATLWVAQGAIKAAPADGWGVTAALGYYHYLDINPDGSTVLATMLNPGNNAGNRLNPPGTYMSDFRIINPFVAATWSGWEEHPVTVVGEFIHNVAAEGGDDDGWAVGVSTKGSLFERPVTVYYQYQAIERESVFAGFAQDDTLFRTNHRTHVAGMNIALDQRIGLHLRSFLSERDELTRTSPTADSDDTQIRLRADLNVKF